jgi:hypothetical protein
MMFLTAVSTERTLSSSPNEWIDKVECQERQRSTDTKSRPAPDE